MNIVSCQSNTSTECSVFKLVEQIQGKTDVFIESMIDAMPNPVFYKDEEGRYLGCNIAFSKQIVGLPKEKIINRTVYDFPDIIPKDLADIYHRKDLELIHKPGVQHYESEVLGTDGLRHVFLINKASIKDSHGKVLGIIGVMQDVTENRKKEESLEQIVQGNSIPTFVIDKNHIITHWNRACERMTGISATEMVGTGNQWNAFYPTKRPVLADLVLDRKSPKDISKYYGDKCRPSDHIEDAYEMLDFFPTVGKQGTWLFFTAAPLKYHDGNIMGVIETLQDFTATIKAREELSESENLYRLLAENIADGVAIFQENKIIYANKAYLKIIGYSAEKIAQINPRELFREDFKKHFDDIVLSIQNGIKIDKFTAPFIRGDGNHAWLESCHNTIEWKGKPAVLATVRDVTTTKLREESLEEESEHLRWENMKLRSSIKDRFRLGDIIGKSHLMQEVYEQIIKASKTYASVIITGESGTGKELAAREIHKLGNRSDMNFVPVNCGAIPDKLLESEFFGYKKGAFSDAQMDKHGYLDLADKGSLFLDELGELESGMQVKLLRALDSGGYYPIGCNTIKQSDFRIIAATNRNLRDLVNNGAMREDFFFRLHVISISLPPLRERKEDIPLLIDHFLKLNGNRKNITTIPGKILDQMYHYHWPGNVRELQNMLHRFMTMGHIEFIKHDKPAFGATRPSSSMHHSNLKNDNLQDTIGTVEKDMIINALKKTSWNRTKASSLLGISRRALYRKMENYHLNQPF